METLYRLRPLVRPLVVTERARENRAFVRCLLKEKQPEFAAMLELVTAELLAEAQGGASRGSAGVSCGCR